MISVKRSLRAPCCITCIIEDWIWMIYNDNVTHSSLHVLTQGMWAVIACETRYSLIGWDRCRVTWNDGQRMGKYFDMQYIFFSIKVGLRVKRKQNKYKILIYVQYRLDFKEIIPSPCHFYTFLIDCFLNRFCLFFRVDTFVYMHFMACNLCATIKIRSQRVCSYDTLSP